MMSGNIKIQWNNLADAQNDMQVLTANMRQAMEELITGVESLKQAARGSSANAWQTVQTQLQTAIDKMDSAFNQGHMTLSNMADTHRDHDHRGANAMPTL
ncbi:hypothetical protein AB0J38_30675 [Streptomyces sp. NPDC050095]|uniref:WXG100 family type VII secretion target n=1 Tax=unclassified Streptomyces TaxID=2593676 RepID=UPI003426683C